jgi:hypothetical protein
VVVEGTARRAAGVVGRGLSAVVSPATLPSGRAGRHESGLHDNQRTGPFHRQMVYNYGSWLAFSPDSSWRPHQADLQIQNRRDRFCESGP